MAVSKPIRRLLITAGSDDLAKAHEEKDVDKGAYLLGIDPKEQKADFKQSFGSVPILRQKPTQALSSGLAQPEYEIDDDLGLADYVFAVSFPNQQAELEFRKQTQHNASILRLEADVPIAPHTCPACEPDSMDDWSEVQAQLGIGALQGQGLTGQDVRVAVVDAGLNKNTVTNWPGTIDEGLSWSANPAEFPALRVGMGSHGDPVASVVGMTAPGGILVDIAAMVRPVDAPTNINSKKGQRELERKWLQEVVRAYGHLQKWKAAHPSTPLVINNSWGIAFPNDDLPAGHPGAYFDNPRHCFNRLITSLDVLGADIVFAAGNCGIGCTCDHTCPDEHRGILGANASQDALCVTACGINNQRKAYATQGPGALSRDKPDVACFTDFVGADHGYYQMTSAATPLAAGVIASIRQEYGPDRLSPEALRHFIRRSARDVNGGGFDYEYGFGILDAAALLKKIESSNLIS